jgi:uncharacterized protein (DUF427 family)
MQVTEGQKTVMVFKDQQLLAETGRPLFVEEDGQPTRLWVPEDDLTADASAHEGEAWFRPATDIEQLAGHVAFNGDAVEIWEKV